MFITFIAFSEAVRVTPHHCDLLSEADGSVWLQPVNGKTFLNGQEVVMKKQLHHGDRIILAAEFYFRLILPDQNSRFGTVVTFEAAKAELFESETQRFVEKSSGITIFLYN